MAPGLDRLLAGLKPAAPPPGVGPRVLAAAHRGDRSGARPAMLVDRLWQSTRLWMIWAAAVTVLLTVNVAVSPPEGRKPPGRGPTEVVITELAVTATAPNTKKRGPTLADSAGLLRVMLNGGPTDRGASGRGKSA